MGIVIYASILVFVIVIILIIKKMKKKDDYIGLDERLSGVKNRWSECCKKIGRFFGV